MSEKIHKIGIVGGGAAGLMAACQLKRIAVDRNLPVEITILERMSSVGNKLLLTGHGRCNITNRQTRKGTYKASSKLYFEASNFMSLLINNYDSEDTIAFIEETLGVPLKEEENGRMFPVSNSAVDIKDAMLQYLDRGNTPVHIITSFRASELIQLETGIRVDSENGLSMTFDNVILATGGQSFSRTGSSGDGYKLASETGHNIIATHGGLAAIEVVDSDKEFTASVAGVAVNARASFFLSENPTSPSSNPSNSHCKVSSVDGDVLFTHEGLSGPAVMELSREIPSDFETEDGWVELDFAPQYDDSALDKDLLNEINNKPQSLIHNVATRYVPSSLSKALTLRAEVTDLTARDMRKEDRKALVKELKHLRLGIERAPNPETAYVTVGGVDLHDIERKTMRSKICKNLYIIGELLNIDGKSGGFNLQACMSEAHAAAANLLLE